MAAEEDETTGPDLLDEAREVLRRAAEARGAEPEVLDIPRPGRDDDPLAAAREALEKAARARSEAAESPRAREARVRAVEQLERLKSGRIGAPPPESDEPAPPAARKRRL